MTQEKVNEIVNKVMCKIICTVPIPEEPGDACICGAMAGMVAQQLRIELAKELIEETPIERTQNILLKEKEHFIEIDIKLPDGRLIGTAEIEPNEKMLERFTIFEPYQNLKYGQQALSELINIYGIKKLWVRSDNEKAIHIYKKAGFKKNKETMFEMSI